VVDAKEKYNEGIQADTDAKENAYAVFLFAISTVPDAEQPTPDKDGVIAFKDDS